jgi:DNA-binding response OmpR family regulator
MYKGGRSARVLVFEEHAESRLVMCMGLRNRGHVVFPAASAKIALAGIEAFHPEVVLLEWHARNDCGVGLARAMRTAAAPLGGELLVIVTSTQNEPDDFRAREAIDEYLVKPIDFEDIERIMRRFAVPRALR